LVLFVAKHKNILGSQYIPSYPGDEAVSLLVLYTIAYNWYFSRHV